MSTGIGNMSLMGALLSRGAVIAIGIVLLCALVLLVVNKRNKPVRVISVAVIVFAVIYFALIAALVFLFGSSGQPPIR